MKLPATIAFLLVTCLGGVAQADIAPPRLTGCRVVEVGTPCYIEGTKPGVCMMKKGDKTCVPQPSASAATSALVPTDPPPSRAPSREPASPPSGGCSAAGGGGPTGPTGLFALFFVAATVYARRRRLFLARGAK